MNGKKRGSYEKTQSLDMPLDEALERFGQTDPTEMDVDNEKVRLVERDASEHPLLIYSTPSGIEVDLPYRDGTLWANQDQMASMFGLDRTSITKHLKNIYDEGELAREATCEEISQVQQEGARTVRRKRPVYNLNAIISVGYRAGSKQGTMFRIWSTDRLVQILTKGFYLDNERLKDPQRNSYLDELLEEISDIRASEANVWKRILELISKCSDYHMMTKQDRSDYFAAFQNAMHWAVATMTAGEIVDDRLDASKPHAGLTSFPGINDGKMPRVVDAGIAKNLFGPDEIKRLNMITNLALDFLGSQAEQGRLATVAGYTTKLRELLTLDGRPLIPAGHKGSVSDAAKKKKATAEIAAYKERVRLEKEAKGERSLASLMQEARKIAGDKTAKRSAAAKKRKKKD